MVIAVELKNKEAVHFYYGVQSIVCGAKYLTIEYSNSQVYIGRVMIEVEKIELVRFMGDTPNGL